MRAAKFPSTRILGLPEESFGCLFVCLLFKGLPREWL